MDLLCILESLLWLYLVILIVRIILSWVPSLPEPLMPLARVLRLITDPVLDPLRGLLPPLQLGRGALDLSPILLFIAIRILIAVIPCSP